MKARSRTVRAVIPSAVIGLALTACSLTPTTSAPIDRITEVCGAQPDDITLVDATFLKDAAARSTELRRLATQVKGKSDKAQALLSEYSEDEKLAEIAAAAEQYAAAVTQYASDTQQFGDPLGKATNAEVSFYSACLSAMS